MASQSCSPQSGLLPVPGDRARPCRDLTLSLESPPSLDSDYFTFPQPVVPLFVLVFTPVGLEHPARFWALSFRILRPRWWWFREVPSLAVWRWGWVVGWVEVVLIVLLPAEADLGPGSPYKNPACCPGRRWPSGLGCPGFHSDSM